MKIRMRYRKLGKVRWTSHRDVARMWERAVRRAGLPVAYSEGFSPRAKMSFGLALPTGAESEAEFLDVALVGDVDVAGLPDELSSMLPAGLDVESVVPLSGGETSLQEDVVASTWSIDVPVDPDVAAARVGEVLDLEVLEVVRERKGKLSTDDVRPAIESIAVSTGPAPGTSRLQAVLATRPKAMRPAELVAALWPEIDPIGVRRLAQWIERDGARREPVPSDATCAPHAQVRAS